MRVGEASRNRQDGGETAAPGSTIRGVNDVLYVALTVVVIALLTLLVGVLDRDRSAAPPAPSALPSDGGAGR